jgi:hypothetical protein
MALSNEQKILIFLAILIVVGYYVYNTNETKQTIEKLQGDTSSDNASNDSNDSNDSNSSSDNSSMDSSSPSSESSYDSASNDSTVASVANKQSNTQRTTIRRGKNANTSGQTKQVSYKDGQRGGPGELDKFFISGNVENAAENAEFSPSDFVSGNLAAYSSKKTDEGLLPVEEKDWFEDVTPTKIKNRHLINIYRPVGVNTISTSLKNPSLDIRGAPANPKTVVSPFLNSSIEPDLNIKGLCV